MAHDNQVIRYKTYTYFNTALFCSTYFIKCQRFQTYKTRTYQVYYFIFIA